jgi:hypothetical protein
MKRKKFIQNSAIIAGALVIAKKLGAEDKRVAVACAAPTQTAGTIASLKAGYWGDVSTWGGRVPTAADTVDINHTVTYDQPNGVYAGVNINSQLTFQPDKTTLLSSTKNVVVLGTLQMRPATQQVVHTLRFTGINESSMVGGGMDVLATDIGLWVMGSGQLDLNGTSKTSWTTASTGIASGSTTIPLKDLTGWQIGDDIAITPTEPPTVGDRYLTGFEDKTITAISGNTISMAKTSYAHPMVNNLWTAEVMNLTRNVRIEGTVSGRSHIFIRSTKPQTIRFVAFRYMGPRKGLNLTLGRYVMHFHHCDDGTIGSLVEGCAVRDAGNHSYVPHVSHGITFKNNVAYNVTEAAYWWDRLDVSHKIVYDGNIAALVKFVGGSKDLTETDESPMFASIAFTLINGNENVAINNVAVGTYGDGGGGFNWDGCECMDGVWKFDNNTAHNNGFGIRVWQNSSLVHTIDNMIMYHNNYGVGHGAYANCYRYNGGKYYGNNYGFGIEASSLNSNRVRIENIEFNGAGFGKSAISVQSSPIPADFPTFIRGCTFSGYPTAPIVDAADNELKCIDVIQCSGASVSVAGATTKEHVRIQPASGQSTQMAKSGTTNIAPFAPTLWGNGNGLLGSYFNGNNFQTPVFSRIDYNVSFSEWGSIGIHYKLDQSNHSIRWTGQIMGQFSEAYTFTVESAGGVRLWVDGLLILDRWQDAALGDLTSRSIPLIAGKRYNIKLEYFSDARTAVGLMWASNSLPKEYVPQSQLFSDGTVVPPIIPPVIPPVIPPGQPVVTLTITASPNPARVSQNWKITATSSAGGKVNLSISNSQGVLLGSGSFDSGQSVSTGAGLARGNYYLTATQGNVSKTITLMKQ